MNPTLHKLYTRIENQRNDLLTGVRQLSREQLIKNVAPGTWSVAEILSHIITAERISVQYIQKKLLGIQTVPDSGLIAEVKINLLWISQRLPWLKFTAPRYVVEHTPKYQDLDQITREWDHVRSELQVLLEKVPDTLIRRLIYRHVFAGYLNIQHALIFFHEHIVHHTPQIKRLVRAT